ncbi:MAG: hypothetical protein ABW215_21930 [Kibdelosporangium sp.]
MNTRLVAAGLAVTLTLAGCARNISSAMPAYGDALALSSAVSSAIAAKQSARFKIETTEGEQGIEGEGSYRANGDMRLTVTLTGVGELDVVLDGTAAYAKLPPEAASAVGGNLTEAKPWAKVTADGRDPISRELGPLLTGLREDFDVVTAMEQLRWSGEMVKWSQEALDGKPVTHYWVEVDLPRLKGQTATQLGVLDTAKYEIWLDAANLPVKFARSVPVNSTTDVPVEFEYRDWGQSVDIAPPPPAEVVALASRR